jgi:hypothetical protein
MQFQLRTLFILMAAVCVYLGMLNAPFIISIPLLCAVAWVMPAYWIAGLVYARGARRAYFLGGVAAGTSPQLVMIFYSIMVAMDGPWRWSNWYQRYDWDETWFFNIVASIFLLGPLLIAFLGAWVSYAVYRSLQPADARPEPHKAPVA